MRASNTLGPYPLVLGAATLVCAALVGWPASADAFKTGPRVTRTDLRVSIDPERGLIHETAKLRVEASGAARLSFRIGSGLVVERSSVDAGVVEHRTMGSRLELYLDPPIEGSRTVTLVLSGRPRRGNEDLVTREWALLGADDDWYPRHPGSWGEARVRVECPEDWTAVAPGARLPGNRPGVWEWRTEKPVRTIGIAAAPGLALSEATTVGTRLRLAAPPDGPTAEELAPIVADPLAWLSGALIPYPFDGFNLVLIPGIPGRARASGMLATPAGSPIAGRQDGAPLLTGQWFGEWLAGDGVWMEAFAAWQAVVYAQDRSEPLPGEIADLREGYFRISRSADVPLSRATPGTRPEIVRGKGSAAPAMVRLIVGERRFQRAVQDLFAAPPGPPMTLSEVRDVFEKRAGNPLIRAFSEWFERRGVPRLEFELRTRPSATGGTRADVGIVQLEGVYKLPVEVVFVGAGEEHRETIMVEAETTSLYYVLPFEPKRLEVDPQRRIFQHPWRFAEGAD
jgi:hypothetical protein